MQAEEFKIKVLPCKDKMYRFAKSLLNNAEEAEDTVQDVLLKMWNIREKLDVYNSVEALAVQITKNLCLDKLKSKRNQMIGFEKQKIESNHHSPDKLAEWRNTGELMRQAIESLPEQQKMILRLRDIEEMEFEEIGEITGLDLNNVRVSLSRARKKVREILIQVNNYGI